MRIDATGEFRSVTQSPHRSLTVTGRFLAGGRRVTGRLVVEDTRRACAQELTAGFTALRLHDEPAYQDVAVGASCQAGPMLCTAIDPGERGPSA